MSTGYKLAALVILVAGVVGSGVLAIARSSSRSAPNGGLYLDADASRIVGYAVQRPMYLPPGINPKARPGVAVIPSIKQVEFEYDDDSTTTTGVQIRAIVVTEATHGKLNGDMPAGSGRQVRVRGQDAQISDVQDFAGVRMVAWSEGRVDYEVVASGGISDAELLKVANSMRAVGK